MSLTPWIHDDCCQNEGKQLKYPSEADSSACSDGHGKWLGNGFFEAMGYMNKKVGQGELWNCFSFKPQTVFHQKSAKRPSTRGLISA